jgi:hypothetical protein
MFVSINRGREVLGGARKNMPKLDEKPFAIPKLLAVQAVTDCRWVLLYVQRWLRAPLQRPDGTLVEREEGTARRVMFS